MAGIRERESTNKVELDHTVHCPLSTVHRPACCFCCWHIVDRTHRTHRTRQGRTGLASCTLFSPPCASPTLTFAVSTRRILSPLLLFSSPHYLHNLRRARSSINPEASLSPTKPWTRRCRQRPPVGSRENSLATSPKPYRARTVKDSLLVWYAHQLGCSHPLHQIRLVHLGQALTNHHNLGTPSKTHPYPHQRETLRMRNLLKDLCSQ